MHTEDPTQEIDEARQLYLEASKALREVLERRAMDPEQWHEEYRLRCLATFSALFEFEATVITL